MKIPKIKHLKSKVEKKHAWTAFAMWYRVYVSKRGPYPCYTCDRIVPFEQIQPGHWMTGHTNTNYINTKYIRPQCFYCNITLKGNQGIFWERIEKEIGTEEFMYLRDHSKDFKDISAQDYRDIADVYKAKLANLKE